MKTITKLPAGTIDEKKAIGLLAFISFLFLGFSLIQKVDFGSLGAFNSPEPAPAAQNNPLADQSVSDVVTAALSFKAMLTTTQQATLEKTYTTTLARKWSNLPCGSSCRNGIQFSTLTAAQLTAAKAVIQAALGTGSNNGYDEFIGINNADAYLGANGGGSGYSSGIYFLSYLGTPSTTGSWMLQFGGHHFAANIAFSNGHVIGATPYFMGVEPTSFTYNSVTYAPLNDERDGFRAMLASLTTTQFNTAKLTTTFSDCLMSPGESNGNTNTMPTVKQGVSCSTMTQTQKDLVIAAIGDYVNDLDATTAASIMSLYSSEIDNTYVAFTGSATVGSATTFLSTNTNYVRIDGPHVWIEFVCQNGVVISGQIHFHTVWRDHTSDYGVDLTGTAIDNNLGVANVTKTNLRVYPNPANESISVNFANEMYNAKVSVVDMTGRILISQKFSGSNLNLNTASLAKGNYILSVETEDGNQIGKFVKR